MKRQRRKFPAAFKAKVALAALRGDRTLNEIAAEFEIHPNQVSAWKKQAEESIQDLFAGGKTHRAEQEAELTARLYQQIGQLKVELDWLKKKVGFDD